MLSIDLRGGGNAADAFIRGLDGIRLAPEPRRRRDHRELPGEHLTPGTEPPAAGRAGHHDGLVRISVGIEHIGDLKAEFDSALIAASAG